MNQTETVAAVNKIQANVALAEQEIAKRKIQCQLLQDELDTLVCCALLSPRPPPPPLTTFPQPQSSFTPGSFHPLPLFLTTLPPPPSYLTFHFSLFSFSLLIHFLSSSFSS